MSGLPKWTRPVSIAAITIASLPIDIVAQTVGNVAIDIAGQSVGNVAVNIAASAVTLNVDITAQTVGNISVNIAASAVTLNVDIKSQTVDLNIKTSGGVNIIIDQLTQTAYTERRFVMENNGAVALWTSTIGNNRRGKYYPRGCRGFLDDITIYCRDNAAAGGTITVYIAPYIGAGYLYTADIVVPSSGTAAWRAASFNVMWNYDSMFIFVLSSNADMEFGYDTGTPQDAWASADSGATWGVLNLRLWNRLAMRAETIGDIPVSGTINTIEIPHSAGSPVFYSDTITGDAQVVLDTVHGMGYCEFLRLGLDAAQDSEEFAFSVYCDDVQAWYMQPYHLETWGHTADTPGLSKLAYAANGKCCMLLTTKFEFKRKFEVRGQRKAGGGNIATYVYGIVNLTK